MTVLIKDIVQSAERNLIRSVRSDRELAKLLQVAQGSESYKVASDYALRIGDLTAKAMRNAVLEAAPETIPKEMLEAMSTPLLEAGHEAVGEVTTMVQDNMNAASGVGLEAQVPEFRDVDMTGFTDYSAEMENTADAFEDAIKDWYIRQVDKTIQKNAEQNTKLGLKATVIRTPEAPGYVQGNKHVRSKKGKVYSYPYAKYGEMYRTPCPFCRERAGTYDYDDVQAKGSEVYRRHKNCRCEVTYKQGSFRQDVWSKATWSNDDAEGRKQAIARKTKENKKAEQMRVAEANIKRDVMDRIVDELGWSEKGASIFYEKNKEEAKKVGWFRLIQEAKKNQPRI